MGLVKNRLFDALPITSPMVLLLLEITKKVVAPPRAGPRGGAMLIPANYIIIFYIRIAFS